MNNETKISKALALYQNGSFASKAAQKDAISKLGRAYDDLRLRVSQKEREIFLEKLSEAESAYSVEQLWIKQEGFPDYPTKLADKIYKKVSRVWELPMSLRHVAERHSELVDQLEIANELGFLLDMLETFIDAPISPVKKDDLEERVIDSLSGTKGTLEQKVAKAIEPDSKVIDNGFRSQHWINYDVYQVTNHCDTTFLRRMFFLDGRRVALDECIKAVSADLNAWVAKGSPDLSNATRDEIREFYS